MIIGEDSHPRYRVARDTEDNLISLGDSEQCRGFLSLDKETMRFVSFYMLEPEEKVGAQRYLSTGERVFLAGKIRHPGIYEITDYGEEDGRHYYATELIDGEPIVEYLERVPNLPLSVGLDLCLQLVAVFRALSDHPRILANLDWQDVHVSLSEGQTLRARIGGFGLNRAESSLGGEPLSALWIPGLTGYLWRIISCAVEHTHGRNSSISAEAFLGPFREFTESVTQAPIRHTPEDFRDLELKFTQYANHLSGVLLDQVLWPSPSEMVKLRPRGILHKLLLEDALVSNWRDQVYQLSAHVFSETSNFAVTTVKADTSEQTQFQILPPDRLKGEGGFESLYRKLGHPFLKDHPNFIRMHFLRCEEDYAAIAEEWIHGFSLARLMECRGGLYANETHAILHQMHQIFLQLDGVTKMDDGIGPADVYFHFDSRISETKLARVLTKERLRDWPDYFLKVRLGATTADMVRPVTAVWPEILRRLEDHAEAIDQAVIPLEQLNFLALAVYLTDYRYYQRHLWGRRQRKPEWSSCPRFRAMAFELLVPHVDDERNSHGFSREEFLMRFEDQLDRLSFPVETRQVRRQARRAAVHGRSFFDPDDLEVVSEPGPGATVSGLAEAALESLRSKTADKWRAKLHRSGKRRGSRSNLPSGLDA